MATSSSNPAVLGVKEFQLNLKKEKANLGSKLEKALGVAGLHLQGTSQNLVPVDFGFLKGSAFTRSSGKEFNTVVSIGYTALYAMYVHEHPNGLNPDRFGRPREEGKPQRGNFWDPAGRGQSKFLEAPSRDTLIRRQMLNIIRNLLGLKGEKK
jgi:hypothetical protein